MDTGYRRERKKELKNAGIERNAGMLECWNAGDAGMERERKKELKNAGIVKRCWRCWNGRSIELKAVSNEEE
jgi:hypothetical protein